MFDLFYVLVKEGKDLSFILSQSDQLPDRSVKPNFFSS